MSLCPDVATSPTFSPPLLLASLASRRPYLSSRTLLITLTLLLAQYIDCNDKYTLFTTSSGLCCGAVQAPGLGPVSGWMAALLAATLATTSGGSSEEAPAAAILGASSEEPPSQPPLVVPQRKHPQQPSWVASLRNHPRNHLGWLLSEATQSKHLERGCLRGGCSQSATRDGCGGGFRDDFFLFSGYESSK
ncbi:uncharacterized protein UTRI_01454 [Ustilago trichophora]|uniref:Uncharacterized protein n=1 Tax=Ustilago trichophora TaxID=86804 RepID=A0A5C3DZW6_9BASI|nr:uncharacterized protein UTRI_01454 [Ustilago trichophora]